MTAPLRFDRTLPHLLAGASETFGRVCRTTLAELQGGSPAKAFDLVETLIATKPMNAADRRCMLALRVALRACLALRRAGLPIDFAHYVSSGIAMDAARRIAPALAEGLAAEIRARTVGDIRCPNCSSAGDDAGWTRIVDRSGVAHARFYVDPAAVIAAALPGEDVGPADAELSVGAALQAIDARAPVLACTKCGLRYVGWRSDPSRLATGYARSEAPGCLLDGRIAVGRAHVLAFAYRKAGLPLYLEQRLGGLAGETVYELGCAEGTMISLLRDLGVEAIGSDLDAPKIHYGRQALGLDSLSDQDAFFWSLPAGSLDGLIAFHTLEHVLEVDRYVDGFASALKPGGWLSVSVPRATAGTDGEWRAMGGSHLIGFDEMSLVHFLRRHGFVIQDRQVDDGSDTVPRDPVVGWPDWSGTRGDITIVARKRA